MSFSILKPSPVLAPFIRHYWCMESRNNHGKKHLQRIVPHGFLEWTFYLEDQPVYLRKNKSDQGQAIISGQQYGFYDIAIVGHIQLFSVVFSPFGAKYLLGLPASEFKNQSVSSDLVFKQMSSEIESKLQEANSNEERKRCIETFLMQMLRKRNSLDHLRLASAFQIIDSTKGHTCVSQLASDSCLSRKQFERNFLDFVGISPKKYLRIIRFQHALYLKERHPEINLTQLALEGNYYDQSHMINDFRYFTGFSPKSFFKQCPSYSDYFN